MDSLIINCETGEQTIEPLSPERIAYLEMEAQKTKEAEALAEAEAAKKAAEKAALLNRLGITADEAKLLFS